MFRSFAKCQPKISSVLAQIECNTLIISRNITRAVHLAKSLQRGGELSGEIFISCIEKYQAQNISTCNGSCNKILSGDILNTTTKKWFGEIFFSERFPLMQITECLSAFNTAGTFFFFRRARQFGHNFPYLSSSDARLSVELV